MWTYSDAGWAELMLEYYRVITDHPNF